MGILNRVRSDFQNVKDDIQSQFGDRRTGFNPYHGQNFPEGFVIEELVNNGSAYVPSGITVSLIGNWLPKQPFTYGGDQRNNKIYYSGHAEPTLHVFGPEEKDITIEGRLWAKKLPNNATFIDVPDEIKEKIDALRFRGNVVKLTLGSWVRYGIIGMADFMTKHLNDIDYRITFIITGTTPPTNARLLASAREYPYDINNDIKGLSEALMRVPVPPDIPFSISGAINGITNVFGRSIAVVTNFVDSIIQEVDDIGSAVSRLEGLISHAQIQARRYKNTFARFNSFSANTSLTNQYRNAAYYSGRISAASNITSFLERIREQFNNVVARVPLGRHLYVQGDTLQKISSRFYGTPNEWKRIYDFNNLDSTNIPSGTVLEIPRL